MTTGALNNWRDVQSEVLKRINSRQWKPGGLIPNEVDLAKEFGCARVTVNRALRAVADTGLLDRRRKAGTRVATHPVRRATLSIPIIRQEIEKRNLSYSYSLINSEIRKPPNEIRKRMEFVANTKALHLTALHLANAHPYVYENRWINIDTVPEILEVDLKLHNANEWLVENAPFSKGDIAFSATQASAVEAEILRAKVGDAMFVIERSTWDSDQSITLVRLTYNSGHQMRTTI